MSVMIVEPVEFYCPACDSALLTTGCQSRMCTGYRCEICRVGCDWREPNGKCADNFLRNTMYRSYFPSLPGGDRW